MFFFKSPYLLKIYTRIFTNTVCVRGCSHGKVCLGLEDLLPQWLPHRVTVSQWTQFPSMWTFPQATQVSSSQYSRLPSLRVKRREHGRSCNAFCDLAPEITLHHCFNTLLSHRSVLFNVREDYTKAWTPGGEDHLGHLEGWLAYHGT